MQISRRTLLAAVASAAVASPLLHGPSVPAHAGEKYASNTELYADPALQEGVDWQVRHQYRSGAITAILAPHGGGIETGTSELALAVAGLHPATLQPHGSGPVHDWWMFEGLRSSNNRELHVTSTHCDDPVALDMVRGDAHACALHGCTSAQAGIDGNGRGVVVGGLDKVYKALLFDELHRAGFETVDGDTTPALGGVNPENICNRTSIGAGSQLELTTELRGSFFGTNTRAGRATTTTPKFWKFVDAVRIATAQREG